MNYIILITFGLAFLVGILHTYRWIKSLEGAKRRRFAVKMSVIRYGLIVCFAVIADLLPGNWVISNLFFLVALFGVLTFTQMKIKKMNGAD